MRWTLKARGHGGGQGGELGGMSSCHYLFPGVSGSPCHRCIALKALNLFMKTLEGKGLFQ